MPDQEEENLRQVLDALWESYLDVAIQIGALVTELEVAGVIKREDLEATAARLRKSLLNKSLAEKKVNAILLLAKNESSGRTQ